MLTLLASADLVTWMSICVKALAYATTLMAVGSVLALLSLRPLPPEEMRALRRSALVCAVLAAVVSLARLPLRASFLMGGTWQGASDPVMLAMVSESPLGTSVALRLVGLGLIFGLMVPGRAGRWLAALGAVLAAASFAFRGHALEDPRLLIGSLITLHILGLAFWIGAFAPLYRCAGRASGNLAGRLAHDFGQKALWIVGLLSLAGVVMLWCLTGGLAQAVFSPYGQFFGLKLALFAATMGFAAWNKLRLTPVLLGADPRGGDRLRRSLVVEAALILVILVTTAALTTLASPSQL